MGTEALLHHIPDEYISVWRTKSIKELMEISERMEKHFYVTGVDKTSKIVSDLYKDLNIYIESRIKEEDVDLSFISPGKT